MATASDLGTGGTPIAYYDDKEAQMPNPQINLLTPAQAKDSAVFAEQYGWATWMKLLNQRAFNDPLKLAMAAEALTLAPRHRRLREPDA